MVFPDAVAIYVKRCPGVSVNKFRAALPSSTIVSPSAHIQLQLPSVDALDLRSLQILCDVSTANSTGGPFVLPRYGIQMGVESSTMVIGGRSVGGQANQYYNIWNYIKQEYGAGMQEQPQMSVLGGGADIPPIASTAGTSYTTDCNGTQTPPALTAYTNTNWALSSQTNSLVTGVNQISKDGAGNVVYTGGLPQIIEVFNETCESLVPLMFPSFLVQQSYIDLGFAAPNFLIGTSGTAGAGNPTYNVANIVMQGTVYALGDQFRSFHQSYIQQGNLLEMPFKSVQAWPGSLNASGIDTNLQFSVGTQSLDMLVACFLDQNYRQWGPVAAGTNTSKYFTLGKGTGIRSMNWSINGQLNPAFQVTPRAAWGQTLTDTNLWTAGRGVYKNLNSFSAYLTKWFVWFYSTSIPFAESLQHAISGLDTANANATLALTVQSDPTNVANGAESYSNYPLIYAVTSPSLLVGQGGQVSVRV